MMLPLAQSQEEGNLLHPTDKSFAQSQTTLQFNKREKDFVKELGL